MPWRCPGGAPALTFALVITPKGENTFLSLSSSMESSRFFTYRFTPCRKGHCVVRPLPQAPEGLRTTWGCHGHKSQPCPPSLLFSDSQWLSMPITQRLQLIHLHGSPPPQGLYAFYRWEPQQDAESHSRLRLKFPPGQGGAVGDRAPPRRGSCHSRLLVQNLAS